MLLSLMALILKNFGDFETDTYRRFGNGRLLNEQLIEN